MSYRLDRNKEVKIRLIGLLETKQKSEAISHKLLLHWLEGENAELTPLFELATPESGAQSPSESTKHVTGGNK